MKDDGEYVATVASQHAAYWRGLALRQYLGGPFGESLPPRDCSRSV
jgi:hypothetical protein